MSKIFDEIFSEQLNRSSNYLTYAVPNVHMGNRWVISDIHGCINSLIALIKRIELKKSDQLFFLGDYINKGPDSGGVIDYIIDLIEQGYQIFPLRGNHEENLLELEDHKKKLAHFVIEHHSQNLLNKSGKIRKRYMAFLSKLPYYFDIGDFFIVHAGLNFKINKPLDDLHAMLNIRDFPIDFNWLGDKTIVHGHNPKALSLIITAIATKSKVIPLDNGCVYHGEKPGMGNLLCLNLNDYSLVMQENVERLLEF